MGSIVNVFVGIVTVLIGSALLYVFKLRQLYLVIPRLFEYSTLSPNGKSAEVFLINKGRQTEEDIIIELDKNSNYTLLASSSSQISIVDNKIKIERILPKSSSSILILAEGGNFSSSSISAFSSKFTNGRIIDSLDSVPPNFGNMFIGVLFALGIPLLLYLGATKIPDIYYQYKASKYNEDIRNQWEGIEKFVSTDLSDNYSSVEFPLILQSRSRNRDTLLLQYRAVNKLAAPLDIFASYKGFFLKSVDDRNEKFTIPPYAFEDFTLRCYSPMKGKEDYSVAFLLSGGTGNVVSLVNKIKIE